MKIIPSVWGSLVAFSRTLIVESKASYPDVEIGFVDWDSHATIHELPETDLIGPMALTMTELSPQMFEVSFAIAVSTYNDENLFRMRRYLSNTLEAMRVQKQVPIFNSDTAAKGGYLVITDGTLLAPMTRAETRPFQYVQASGLLEPVLT